MNRYNINQEIQSESEVIQTKLSRRKMEIALAKSGLSSYAQLARKMGCNAQSLYTTMSRNNCRPATVGKIANALEVPVEDLVEGVNE